MTNAFRSLSLQCPYAKGASGNVATEEVVYMLNGMGLDCGIDMVKLMDAAEFICSAIGRPPQSKIGQMEKAKRQAQAKAP